MRNKIFLILFLSIITSLLFCAGSIKNILVFFKYKIEYKDVIHKRENLINDINYLKGEYSFIGQYDKVKKELADKNNNLKDSKASLNIEVNNLIKEIKEYEDKIIDIEEYINNK